MTRTSLSVRVALLVLAVGLAAAATARSGPPEESQRLILLLPKEIDLKDVPDKLKLKDVLELISMYLTKLNMGKEVRVLVDLNAFQAADAKMTSDEILGQDVDIPAFPKQMSVAELLRLSLGKLPGRNATYLIRPGVLEITTRKEASPASLLQRRVAAAFTGRPLKDAIGELCEQTGASVVLDPRAGEKLKTPVTATFRNDTSLGAALRMLADVNDLKLVVLEDGLYITTPANAEAVRKEQAQGHRGLVTRPRRR